eukprot:5624500-Pyramimonas_sp.AAC.1
MPGAPRGRSPSTSIQLTSLRPSFAANLGPQLPRALLLRSGRGPAEPASRAQLLRRRPRTRRGGCLLST